MLVVPTNSLTQMDISSLICRDDIPSETKYTLTDHCDEVKKIYVQMITAASRIFLHVHVKEVTIHVEA